MYTTLAAIDIADFGQRRDDETQRHLRRLMYDVLAESLALTEDCWSHCYHEDRGDGALVIAPPDEPAENCSTPLPTT